MNQNNHGLLFVFFALAIAGNWMMKSHHSQNKEISPRYKQPDSIITLEESKNIQQTGGIERLGLGDDPFGIREKYSGFHRVPELKRYLTQNDFADPPDLRTLTQALSNNLSADPFFQMMQPVDSELTSDYGTRSDPIEMGTLQSHSGEDYAVPFNTEIPSPSDGIVEFAGERTGYGLTVEIKHSEKISSLFAHLNQIDVVPGQQVQEGRIIGRSGSTGRSTGPHLHYELRVDGKPVNPKILAMLLTMLSGQEDPGGF
jgi:murein DD-endopeptidase MepM/ murein hydrolase activator NlpD